MKDPILITGCARSGTSMVAGAINLCGAFGGSMSGPNRNNQRGMYENSAIRQNIVKPYLNNLGVDKLGQYPLPEMDKILIPVDWRARVEQIMKDQGYQGGPWMYKGAKMCLHWSVWHHAFPDAKWVIVRRKTGDIIKSCMNTGFMRAFDNPYNRAKVGAKTAEEGWLWWVHQHEARFREMINEGLNVQTIWPHRFVNRDYKPLHQLIEWLGLRWSEEVFDFIDPKLWHSRQVERSPEVEEKMKQEFKEISSKQPNHGDISNR